MLVGFNPSTTSTEGTQSTRLIAFNWQQLPGTYSRCLTHFEPWHTYGIVITICNKSAKRLREHLVTMASHV